MRARTVFSKAVILVFAVCVLAEATVGQEHPITKPKESYVMTEELAGYSIGLCNDLCSTNTSPDCQLCFAVYSEKNPKSSIVFPSPEFAYRVELLSSNGVPVQKTSLGRKAGSKFDAFDTTYLRLGGLGRQMIWALRKDEPGAFVLFRPSDLFVIQNPGCYLLSIQFQIIIYPEIGPGLGYTNRVIRFPAIQYPILERDGFEKDGTRKMAQ